MLYGYKQERLDLEELRLLSKATSKAQPYLPGREFSHIFPQTVPCALEQHQCRLTSSLLGAASLLAMLNSASPIIGNKSSRRVAPKCFWYYNPASYPVIDNSVSVRRITCRPLPTNGPTPTHLGNNHYPSLWFGSTTALIFNRPAAMCTSLAQITKI